MAKHKYAFENYEQEAMARAVGLTLPLSTKVAVEICNVLRNRSLKSARTFLEGVVALKQAVPYRRFNKDVGHKPGIAAGRYPAKAAKEFLALLKSAEANAQVKGLHSSHLHLIHVCSHKASRPMRYGRHRGRLAKRTHVEIVLREKVQEKSKASSQKKGEKLVSQPKVQKEAVAPVQAKEEVAPVKVEEKVVPAKVEDKVASAKVEEKVAPVAVKEEVTPEVTAKKVESSTSPESTLKKGDTQ